MLCESATIRHLSYYFSPIGVAQFCAVNEPALSWILVLFTSVSKSYCAQVAMLNLPRYHVSQIKWSKYPFFFFVQFKIQPYRCIIQFNVSDLFLFIYPQPVFILYSIITYVAQFSIHLVFSLHMIQ